MSTMNGGLNRIAMSIFCRRRDAVEYITGAPGLSKAKPNGVLYGLRITVPTGHVPKSWMGQMLLGQPTRQQARQNSVSHYSTILNSLEALDKKVDSLENTGNGMRDTIKGTQDDILGLRKAKDETLMYIDERLGKLRKGSATKRGDISVSVFFPER
ncbi:MAG: hypothetical protein M1839_007111 [Geoglossum umbratile]|nr:MAG: hypothetical protein M1839_007111 [Geoglossum umbratile]